MELNIISKTITNFTNHNAQNIYRCNVSAQYLKNFKNVEKFIVNDKFTIFGALTYNNIINLLLNSCKDITMQLYKPYFHITFHDDFIYHLHVVNAIISKYLVLKIRSESIMDCAIELIEAGFEEAAEL